MFVHLVMELVLPYWKEILKTTIETLVIYLVIRFRYRSNKDIIVFPQNVVDNLVSEFDPDDLVKNVPSDMMLPDVYNQNIVDLASFDVFELADRNKDEIVKVIRKYGVGTCGPRAFYGTLDLHLELEKSISRELGVEGAIVYSNSFTAVNSVISCFCRQQDIVFYHEDCNEAILRGISLSRSTTIEFRHISDLETKLGHFIKPNRKNFVIVEGLFRNTGKIVNITKILGLRKKYKFRIILDESCSIPMLNKRGVCGMNGVSIGEIDVLVGSLALGFCSIGAFSTGSFYTVDYQRLSGSSYCFSASTPAALVKAAMLNIKRSFDYGELRSKLRVFHKNFHSKTLEVVSSHLSPIIVIMKKREIRRSVSKDALLKDVLEMRRSLVSDNIVLGLNHNPYPSLRICIKIGMSEAEIVRIAGLLGKL